MKINQQKIEYPIEGKLSFLRIKQNLEQFISDNSIRNQDYIQSLLDQLKDVPELLEGTNDATIIEQHKDLIDLLMRLLFPPLLTTNEIKGASMPFDFDFFYMSERLKKIMADAGKGSVIDIIDFDPDQMYIMGCSTILQAHYKKEVKLSVPIVVELNEKSGDPRYYRVAFNADLMDIVPTKHAKEITEEDFNLLMDNFRDIDLWREKFPPNSYEFRGLGIMNLMDITMDQSINLMTSNLLEGTKKSFEKVIENIRLLLKIDDLNVAFIRAEQDSLLSVNTYDQTNVLMGGIEEEKFFNAFCDVAKDALFERRESFLLTDTDKYLERSTNLMATQLKKRAIGSYMLTPLEYNDKLYGFLELASKNKRELNGAVMEKVKLIIPILSMAASRFAEENRNRIEAIIQEECTSIHPSVKWRFEKAAKEFIESEMEGKTPVFKDIVFSDVVPLYGQIDIRHSSKLRNEAVKVDFQNQLKAVKSIIELAIRLEQIPVYEELLFQIDQQIKSFNGELIEGSEQRLTAFLNEEVYPLFDHLKSRDAKLEKEIESYNNALNKETHMIYEKRKDFDTSVNQLNALMAKMIDEKQQEAQKMFPHYFERYKTDGLEFNSYIGQSITDKRDFNELYLSNLQLWQLQSICEIEYAIHQKKSDLPVALEVASLILLHNTPLSIHFRIDEKRFDVEGAYNARYEIIKKRIDKALIKGTKERLTQAKKIAVVYSNAKDGKEFKKHIKYLEAKGYLIHGSTEELDLEDLQGVSGLQALRVSINYDYADAMQLKVDGLLKDLKKS